MLGVLVDRAARYRIERDAWHWWTDELAWRRLPAAQKRRVPGVGQAALPFAGHDVLSRHRRGPHPRLPDGRADFTAARQQIADGTYLTRTA